VARFPADTGELGPDDGGVLALGTDFGPQFGAKWAACRSLRLNTGRRFASLLL
jgi:hypothetical protein